MLDLLGLFLASLVLCPKFFSMVELFRRKLREGLEQTAPYQESLVMTDGVMIFIRARPFAELRIFLRFC